MGFCPDFDYDLFISYSHLNNEKLGTEDQGWVTDLHDVLRKRLAEKLSMAPAIWRDVDGLEGRTITDGIRTALENSAIFLAVVSRPFLSSTYCCPVELSGFHHPKFPLVVRDHSRLVVAAYQSAEEAPRSTWPPALQDVPCVEFCDEGSSVPYTRTSRIDPKEPYWQKVEKLVQHIQETLFELQKGLNGAEVSTLAPPALSAQKPQAAWQKRWQKPLVHITYQNADRVKADRLAGQLSDRCTVTLLPGDTTDERRQRTYLQNADGQILLFGCSDRAWAEDQALRSLAVASEQGRPKRLAICTDASCLQDFAIRSDFVVPLVNAEQATDDFITSLGSSR